MSQFLFKNHLNILDNTSEVTLEALKKYLNDYPYCQSAHKQLLLSLVQKNQKTETKQLASAAAYSPCRATLYRQVQELIKQHSASQQEKNDDKFSKDTTGTEQTTAENIINNEALNISEAEDSSIKSDHRTEASEKDAALRAIVEKRLKEINKEQEAENKPATDGKLDKQKIVENFLENEPRITPKKDMVNDADLSHQSVIDKLDYVSETLAQIYEQQGNFDKAVKTYEKLSLKYPEKSAYFAREIEKIKKQTKK